MIRTLLLSFSLSLSVALHAQNSKEISAFASSYSAESVKDYEAGINQLKSVYNENGYEINLRLGWLYYLNKDYTQSERYYRQAIKINGNSIEALMGFVNPAAALQQWTDVFSTYQRVLKLDPNHSVANYRIAIMYYYRKEFANAEKHLSNVLGHYPFDYDSLLLMAQVKLAEGKITDSKSYYERVLLYSPSNTEIKKIIEKL